MHLNAFVDTYLGRDRNVTKTKKIGDLFENLDWKRFESFENSFFIYFTFH